jgi:hypothetical protein
MSGKNTKKAKILTAASQFRKAATSAGIATQAGKGAIKAEYRGCIVARESWTHTESIDVDAHFLGAEPNAPRWDYGVGLKNGNTELAFWIEPHPASSTGEVKGVIAKILWLKTKLSLATFSHLRDLTEITRRAGHNPYQWLHAGSLQITRGSREARLLAQAGVAFPRRHIELPS